MNARLEAVRHRQQAGMLDACADMQDRLAKAKAAYAADPSPENRAARRAAMAEAFEFRAWVRGVARLRKVRAEVAALPDTHPRRAALEAELGGLEHRWGQLADGLEALAGPAASQPLPEGSVEVAPATVRAKGRVRRVGGGA